MADQLTDKEIADADQEAQKIYVDLVSNKSRATLLWLCSYLNRWQHSDHDTAVATANQWKEQHRLN